MCVECRLGANGADDPIRPTVFDDATTHKSKFTWTLGRHGMSVNTRCPENGKHRKITRAPSTVGEVLTHIARNRRTCSLFKGKYKFTIFPVLTRFDWSTRPYAIQKIFRLVYAQRFENDFDCYYFVVRRPTTPESIPRKRCRANEFCEILQFPSMTCSGRIVQPKPSTAYRNLNTKNNSL